MKLFLQNQDLSVLHPLRPFPWNCFSGSNLFFISCILFLVVFQNSAIWHWDKPLATIWDILYLACIIYCLSFLKVEVPHQAVQYQISFLQPEEGMWAVLIWIKAIHSASQILGITVFSNSLSFKLSSEKFSSIRGRRTAEFSSTNIGHPDVHAMYFIGNNFVI